jgi:hypothetical protein
LKLWPGSAASLASLSDDVTVATLMTVHRPTKQAKAVARDLGTEKPNLGLSELE